MDIYEHYIGNYTSNNFFYKLESMGSHNINATSCRWLPCFPNLAFAVSRCLFVPYLLVNSHPVHSSPPFFCTNPVCWFPVFSFVTSPKLFVHPHPPFVHWPWGGRDIPRQITQDIQTEKHTYTHIGKGKFPACNCLFTFPLPHLVRYSGNLLCSCYCYSYWYP